jgi:hypothetical protein
MTSEGGMVILRHRLRLRGSLQPAGNGQKISCRPAAGSPTDAIKVS